MNEELNPMVTPHAPLPLPYEGNQYQFEVDPVRIDAIIDALVGLNPIALDITGIRLLRSEAAVNIDFLNARLPERLDCGPEPLQQPSTAGRETEAFPDLFQRSLMISWWQPASDGIKSRNQKPPSIMSGTIINVNTFAVDGQR